MTSAIASRCFNNVEKEFERNRERYEFLKWGQKAFQNFRVVPPATGIVHQVNLEYLAKVVMVRDGVAFPDSLVGTDSHTTMINGLGVVGWGVGGIEAEACMLGPADLHGHAAGRRLQAERRACPKARPRPIWCWSSRRFSASHGVVEKFVEFYGDGLATHDRRRPRHHRQHGSGIRRDDGILPGRRSDAGVPAPDRPRREADRSGRAILQGAGPVASRRAPSRTSPKSWNWICAR